MASEHDHDGAERHLRDAEEHISDAIASLEKAKRSCPELKGQIDAYTVANLSHWIFALNVQPGSFESLRQILNGCEEES